MTWCWCSREFLPATAGRLAVTALLVLGAAACGPADGNEGDTAAMEAGVGREAVAAPVRPGSPLVDRSVRRRAEPPPEARSLPEGTVLRLRIEDAVSTASHAPGDAFVAEVSQAVLGEDGRPLVPEGAILTGVVTESRGPGAPGGRAVLGLALRSIVVGERRLPLRASIQQARLSDPGSAAAAASAARIAIGTAADAVIASAIGQPETERTDGRQVHAAELADTELALVARGGDAVLPEGSRIRIELTASLGGLPVVEVPGAGDSVGGDPGSNRGDS